MVDVLKVKSGVTLRSLFAVGGAGTVFLSLAVKDIASEVVSGLALQASDKVYEGEKVMFGNGLKGTVDQIDEYADSFLKVIVDVRINVTPDSDTCYFNNREQVLLAIGRAVKKTFPHLIMIDGGLYYQTYQLMDQTGLQFI